jgi:hypothetical protein
LHIHLINMGSTFISYDCLTTISLKKLAIKLGTDGPVKVIPASRQISLLFNGAYILKTTNSRYVWEHPYYPQLYVPASELHQNTKNVGLTIKDGETFKTDDGKKVGKQLTLTVGKRSIDQVISFDDSLSGNAEGLRGLVKIDFESVDQWSAPLSVPVTCIS